MTSFFIAKIRKFINFGNHAELSMTNALRLELCNLAALAGIVGILLSLCMNAVNYICFDHQVTIYQYVILSALLLSFIITLLLNRAQHFNFGKLMLLIPLLVLSLLGLYKFGHNAGTSCVFIWMIVMGCFFLKIRHAIIFALVVIVSVLVIDINLLTAEPIKQISKTQPLIAFAISAIMTLILTNRMMFVLTKHSRININQNKLLIEKNRELESFTYIASHDLKSPLINVLTFTKLLKKDLKANKYNNTITYCEIIESSASQMKNLIEDVLELTRTNEDKSAIHKEFSLEIALNIAINNLAIYIDDKNVELNFGILPNYYGHQQDFVQVFQNLIQNGIKYNKSDHPIIEVDFKEKDEKLLITFKDNGIGVAEEHFEEIFEFFKRLHNHQEFKGTGLGLGLCKKIINQYSGDIRIHSKVDKGSVFVIELPAIQIQKELKVESLYKKHA